MSLGSFLCCSYEPFFLFLNFADSSSPHCRCLGSTLSAPNGPRTRSSGLKRKEYCERPCKHPCERNRTGHWPLRTTRRPDRTPLSPGIAVAVGSDEWQLSCVVSECVWFCTCLPHCPTLSRCPQRAAAVPTRTYTSRSTLLRHANWWQQWRDMHPDTGWRGGGVSKACEPHPAATTPLPSCTRIQRITANRSWGGYRGRYTCPMRRCSGAPHARAHTRGV